MSFVEDAIALQQTADAVVKQQKALSPAVLRAQFPGQTISRVAQIEGHRTNEEIIEIIRDSFFQIFDLPIFEWVRFQYSEELVLALRLVLYKGTVWDRYQSVGDRMQNLLYRNERAYNHAQLASSSSLLIKSGHHVPHQSSSSSGYIGPLALATSARLAPTTTQKCLHVLLSIVLPYAIQKLITFTVEQDWEFPDPQAAEGNAEGGGMEMAAYNAHTWRDMLRRVMHARNADGSSVSWLRRIALLVIEIRTRWRRRSRKQWAVVLLRRTALFLSVLQFLHMLLFLVEGKYRSLTDRVLQMRLVHGKPTKLVSSLNIGLVSQHVTYTSIQDLFEAVSPFWHGSRQQVHRFAAGIVGAVGGAVLPLLGMRQRDPSPRPVGRGVAENPTVCVWCTQRCVMTQTANCGHTYCYYCIASTLPPTEEERHRSGIVCPACHNPLRSFRPHT